MHIVVAIVAYRNPDDLVRCLAALAASTHADFEIVICENGGDAALATLLSTMPNALPGGQPVRIFGDGQNLGFGGGVNRCLQQSPTADAWWVLNPDTEPRPDCLAALIARLDAGDCDAVGGVLHQPDGSIGCYGGLWRPWLARSVALGQGAAASKPIDTAEIERRQNYLSGASMLLTPRFLTDAGPIREDYFLYGEDVEWCLRGIAKGLRLGFCREAVVVHHQGSTTGSGHSVRQRPRIPVYLDARNQILLTRDRFPGLIPVVAVTALLLLAAQYLRRGAWRQFRHAVAGWSAGLAGERGRPAWIANLAPETALKP